MSAWTIESGDDARPFTANTLRRLHWSKQRRLIADYRALWALLAAAAKLPRPIARPVRIDVWPLHKNRCSPQDAGACAPATKAAIDGIVDAGRLTDDSQRYVVGITHHAPIVCGRNGLRITISEV